MENSIPNYMQKDVNIRISNECKNQLDWFKKTYDFKTFNESISQVYYFFKRNNVSPREQISNVFLKNFFELKSDLKNFNLEINKNLRENAKILKSNERDILLPMSRKINAIFENKTEQSIGKRNDFLIEKAEEPNIISQQNKKIISLTQDLNSKNQRLNLMQKNIEEINEDLIFYSKLYKTLKENTKIEKQLIGKSKVITEWDIEEWKRILEYGKPLN